jgi:N-acetylneuraminate synthase/N,N'-diacetyllegionaminate synthase
VPAFKIGSGERGNFQYLRTIASRGKPIVLSTGMYDGDDVRRTLEVLAEAGSREVALLHCVTSYPTPPEQVNLRAMDTLRRLFGGPVGYSDHTSDHLAVLAAVARGAKLIEKHISLDFNVPNAQDWKVSAGPHDLAKLIGDIRTVEASLGREEKAAQPCEQAATHWALKGLYSAVDLAAGDVLTAETIVAKRPAGGIPAAEFDRVVGRRVARSLRADQPIEWDALA